MKKRLPQLSILALVLVTSVAWSGTDPLAANRARWERLPPAERQALRERAARLTPERLALLRERLARFRALPEPTRQALRDGLRRFLQLSPERRQELRERFQAWRRLSETERRQLREQFRERIRARLGQAFPRRLPPPAPADPAPAKDAEPPRRSE